jgi:predicted phage tail protein
MFQVALGHRLKIRTAIHSQFASVLDLLSEGEIQGLDNGLKSVFLDNTPVVSSSGANNFSQVTRLSLRLAPKRRHTLLPLKALSLKKVSTLRQQHQRPVTRSITDTNVDRVRVTIQLPSVCKINQR